MDGKKKKKDIFRDTPVRYLGYANEVGESFHFIIPKLLKPSYVLSFGYVFADTISKSRSQYLQDKRRITKMMMYKGLDCLLWQSFASVIIPGFIINRIVKASTLLLNIRSFRRFPMMKKNLPCLIGLTSIYFIVPPIDNFCHYVMDQTLRRAYQ